MKSSDARDSVDSFDVIIYDPVNSVIVCHRVCDDVNSPTADCIFIEENTPKLNMIIPSSVRDRCKVYIVTHPSCRDVLTGPLLAVEAFVRTADALFDPVISEKYDSEFLLEIAYAFFNPTGPNFSLFKRPGYNSFLYKLV